MVNRSQFRLDTDMLSLRAFVAVAEESSFSAAAKQVSRTQSAVSAQIAKLEDRMGTRLFERTSRSVKLTTDGEMLLASARRILSIADEVMTAISAPDVSGPFRIGFADHLVQEHLHQLLGRFQRAHPKVPIELRIGHGFELLDAVDAGNLDVVVAGPGGVDGKVLAREPLVWVGPVDYVFKKDEPVPLVLMQEPCSYRLASIHALTSGDLTFRVTVEADSILGIQSAVAAGLGVSVVGNSAVTEQMKVLDDVFPTLPETSLMAYLPPDSDHPLMERFLSFLEEGLASVGIGN